MEPPKLNAEIKASLSDPLIKRDAKMIDKQQKVSVCLAALGSLLTRLANKEEIDRVPLITLLNDTTRLMVDLQRGEMLTRRLIIFANLNPSIKDTLNTAKADEWLFNKDLSETLKVVKSLEKSSKDPKQAKKSQPATSLPKKSKNGKGPPRQTSYRQPRARRQNSTNRQKSYNYRRRNRSRTERRSSHRRSR